MNSITGRVRIVAEVVLANDWATLKKTVVRWQRKDGQWQQFSRETYDRGNGAVLLPFNKTNETVLLVKQFRYPPFSVGHRELLIEAPAGLLDDATPESRIREEVEEETGYRLGDVHKVFEMFMSPGSVTEKLHFFTAEYDSSMRISDGGGKHSEGEDIEVMEVPLSKAIDMVDRGEIVDAKTVLLLLHLIRRLA